MRCLVRPTLTTLFLATLLVTISFPVVSARKAQQGRVIGKRPFSVEPVKVVAAKTKRRPDVKFGDPFEDEDDWLDGLTLTVVNNSNRVVASLTVEVTVLRPAGDARPPVGFALHYGPSPTGPEYAQRNPGKALKVRRTVDLVVTPDLYESLKGRLQRQGYPAGVSRINVKVSEVGFEDGSVLINGQYHVRDPNDPYSIEKMTPAGRPRGSALGRPDATAAPYVRLPAGGAFFGKVSAVRPAQGCYDRMASTREWCDFLVCSIRRDRVDPMSTGNYIAELEILLCERWDTQTNSYHTCPGDEYAVPRVYECIIHGCPYNMLCNWQPQESGWCMEPADPCIYPENNGCPWGQHNNGGCCCNPTPILIDTAGDGFALTGSADGVLFDIGGSGRRGPVSWTAAGADDAWLALDRNGNGQVDGGAELFGNVTPQPAPPSGQAKNGFLALAVYDAQAGGGNGDGVISRRDAVFASLRLWRDANHNGVSEPTELHGLAESGISELELNYKESSKMDEHGNLFKYRAKVKDAKGAQAGRWAWDVVLVPGQ